jgi:hypothetical protein
MDEEFGPAVTWILIIMAILTLGLMGMMLDPIMQKFLLMGLEQTSNGGTDPVTMGILADIWNTYLWIAVVFTLIFYGWRRTHSNRVG